MKLKKNRYNSSSIDHILNEKFPDCLCPVCNRKEIYAGCVDSKYDEENDEDILNSFSVFCKSCGTFFGGWDNTNRVHWIK